jgi:hypothetical protein
MILERSGETTPLQQEEVVMMMEALMISQMETKLNLIGLHLPGVQFKQPKLNTKKTRKKRMHKKCH